MPAPRSSRQRRRPTRGSPLWIFIRLARPHFLAGGFLLYGLGALIARYERVELSLGLYLAGQALVTSLQLMTHFLNEYWDIDSDRANPNRTLFSGGSGMIAAGFVPRQTAFGAALACLVGAAISAFALALTLSVGSLSWAIAGVALAGTWFYSSPPLQLASTGFGELTTSLLVALLVPAFAYSLQAGHVSPTVLLTALPLLALHVAMLLAFEVPDAVSDEATGKRTLFVRLGRQRGVLLHQILIVAAYILLGLAFLFGVPLLVILSGLVPFPIALAQMVAIRWLGNAGADSSQNFNKPYQWLTVGAVSLFAITAGLMALGYWRLG